MTNDSLPYHNKIMKTHMKNKDCKTSYPAKFQGDLISH